MPNFWGIITKVNQNNVWNIFIEIIIYFIVQFLFFSFFWMYKQIHNVIGW